MSEPSTKITPTYAEMGPGRAPTCREGGLMSVPSPFSAGQRSCCHRPARYHERVGVHTPYNGTLAIRPPRPCSGRRGCTYTPRPPVQPRDPRPKRDSVRRREDAAGTRPVPFQHRWPARPIELAGRPTRARAREQASNRRPQCPARAPGPSASSRPRSRLQSSDPRRERGERCSVRCQRRGFADVNVGSRTGDMNLKRLLCSLAAYASAASVCWSVLAAAVLGTRDAGPER